MTTPPSGPYGDRPQDGPSPQGPHPGQYGGQPGQYPPGQPGQYPPGQPGQYPPAQPGQYPPGQPGGAPYQAPQGYNPYGQGGYGQGYGYAPPGQLAGWPIRVGASLLDSLLPIIPAVIGITIALIIDGNDSELGAGGGAAMIIGYLCAMGLAIWNRIIRQGRTGQSVGKKVLGLKIVHAQTGQLIGVGSTFGREVCAVIFNNVCFLNLLWPLWDEKQQTWHDKVVNDVVVRI